TPSLFVAGIPGVAVTGPVWVGMLALAFVPWGGRPAIDTIPTAGHFLFSLLCPGGQPVPG
ncbi:MAG: hypothetical protein ACYDC9_12350, partial [Dermatophilaceae bacterium]